MYLVTSVEKKEKKTAKYFQAMLFDFQAILFDFQAILFDFRFKLKLLWKKLESISFFYTFEDSIMNPTVLIFQKRKFQGFRFSFRLLAE